MDDQRFDALTRALARAHSRRGLLKTLAAGALGGFAAVATREVGAAPGCRGAGHPCEGNQTCCDGLNCTASGPGAALRCTACPAGTKACGSTCAACCADNECPGAACSTGVCTNGTCGLTRTPDCCTQDSDCDDGNACTTDSCDPATNRCVHTPITCQASDQCHGVGTCDSSTGTCTNPPLADGTTCAGTNRCFETYTCQQGACTGGDPVVCAPLDQCHAAGACDRGTGTCTNPNQPDGTSCNDGNACTTGDTCQGGVCTGGSQTICAQSSNPCLTVVCDPAQGCVVKNQPSGTACSDNNDCTTGDACDGNGNCVPGKATTCDPCLICDPGDGTCKPDPTQNKRSCPGDGNKCFGSFVCNNGSCVGTQEVVCQAQDQCHVAGTCDPTTGTCSNPDASDGTACDDHNKCTQMDVCLSGVCTGTNPVVCSTGEICNTISCNPATGVCDQATPDPDGTPCNTGGLCTVGQTCQQGSCTGGQPKTCFDSNPCTADSCDPTTGDCVFTPVPNGTDMTQACYPPPTSGIYSPFPQACYNGQCCTSGPGNYACFSDAACCPGLRCVYQTCNEFGCNQQSGQCVACTATGQACAYDHACCSEHCTNKVCA